MEGWSPSNYNIFYRTQIWLPKILTGQEFSSKKSLNIVDEVIEVDEVDKGDISGRQPLVKDDLLWKMTFC